MRKRAWIAIAFLGMVMSAIIGIASADEFSRDKYSGREQVISIDVVRDGSVAYASLWTSYAVDRWDVLMKVASVDPYTGEVRTSVTAAAGVMSNGTTLVRRAFGKEFLYNVNFDDNEYIDVQHGFVTDTASHTAKNELSWKWNLPEAIPTPTAAPTAMPTPTPVVTATPTPTPMVYPVSNHITWARPFARYAPTEEEQLEINRLLYEKGLDCAIDFVNMGVLMDGENELWMEQQYAAGAVPDILFSGLWTDTEPRGLGTEGAYEFARDWFLPLQDYFGTEDGNRLRDCFSETSWKDVTVDGNAYVVPLTFSSYGVYLLVNNEYASYFDGFDGTYQSLRAIYDTIGDPALQIVIPRLDQRIVSALLGYSSFGQLPYDTGTHQIKAFRGFAEAAAMWNSLYHDIGSGLIGDRSLTNGVGDRILAEYVVGAGSVGDGYTVFRIDSDNYRPSLALSLGIYRDSPRKELALKVLSVCMEDPEIRVLLQSGRTTAEQIARTEKIRESEEAFELAGFVPTMTEEQRTLYLRIMGILSASDNGGMVYVHNNSGTVLAKDFNAATLFSQFSGDDVDALIGELNRQIAEYLVEAGRQS